MGGVLRKHAISMKFVRSLLIGLCHGMYKELLHVLLLCIIGSSGKNARIFSGGRGGGGWRRSIMTQDFFLWRVCHMGIWGYAPKENFDSLVFLI